MQAPDEGAAPEGIDDATAEVEGLLLSCMDAEDVDAALDDVCSQHPQHASKLRAVWSRMQGLGLSPKAASDESPTRIGPFRIVDRLGEGGMGVVYVCEQDHPRRTVAVKVVRPELLHFEGKRARFEREIEATARLAHPGIVPILEVGHDGGAPWYSMEYVRGASLAQAIKALSGTQASRLTGESLLDAIHNCMREEDRATIDFERCRKLPIFTGSWCDAILSIVTQVTEAIDHAHAHGILHRDIKPSNIMVTPDGRALLVDFGLARASKSAGDQTLTRSTSSLGSLPYMPPEVLRGHTADARADVYGIGVTLYEALTLQHAFLDSTAESTRSRVLDGRSARIRTINSTVPWDLDTVCRVAMAPEHGRRYRDIRSLREDLGRLRARLPILARRPGALIRLRRWQQRNPGFTIFAATTICLLVAAGFVLYAIERRGRIAEGRLRARAERSLYISQLSQALSAIAMDNFNQARQVLDGTDKSQREFMWKHFKLRTDSEVQRWDFGEQGMTRHAISPDQHRIVVASSPKTLRIMPLVIDEKRASIDTSIAPIELPGDAHFISISQDSKTAIVSPYDGSWIDVFDIPTKKRVTTFEYADQSGFMAQFLAEDTSFVAMSTDGRCIVRDRDSGVTLREWQALPVDRHVSKEFVLDESRSLLACVSERQPVCIYDSKGERIQSIDVPGVNVDSMTFAAGGKELVVGSYEIRSSRMYVNRYRIDDGSRVKDYDVLSTPSSVAVHPGGQWLVIIAATIQVNDYENARRLRTLNGPTQPTEIARFDSRGFLWTTSNDGALRRWSLTEPAYETTMPGNANSITALGLARNGSTIVSADKDGTVVIGNMDARMRKVLDLTDSRAIAVATDPTSDSSTARVVFRDGTVSTLDLIEAKETSRSNITPDVAIATWCRDALLTVHGDGRLRAFAPSGQTELPCDFELETPVTRITASGDRVAIGTDDRVVLCTVDPTAAARGASLLRIDRTWPYDSGITALAFDSKAARLAIATESFQLAIRDIGSDETIFASEATNSRFSALAFMPGDEYLAAANWSSQIWMFDPRAGQPLGHFFLGTMPLCLATSPDGRFLATGNINRHVHFAWFERRP
ncbi:MAG: protein kinase [Planctomycetes bacterium]|nr:protein kinase [Planctomycetota bacterium]